MLFTSLPTQINVTYTSSIKNNNSIVPIINQPYESFNATIITIAVIIPAIPVNSVLKYISLNRANSEYPNTFLITISFLFVIYSNLTIVIIRNISNKRSNIDTTQFLLYGQIMLVYRIYI